MIYHDAEQYRLACELWQKERVLFEAQEAERLASLQKQIADSPRNHPMILLYPVAIAVAVAAGCAYGASRHVSRH